MSEDNVVVLPDEQSPHSRLRRSPARRAWMRDAAALFRAQSRDRSSGRATRDIAVTRVARPIFEAAEPFPGVLPAGYNKKTILAQDDAISLDGMVNFAGTWSTVGEGMGFLGYANLAELSQRPEFRKFSEIIAEEMVRKFFKIVSASDESQSTRIRLLNDAITDKYKLKDIFRKIAECDALYGRANLYVDMGPISPEEKRTPLRVGPDTIPLHSLKGFRVIEPFWTYPATYNAIDPTELDFYNPQSWYVMGKQYHHTRMLNFVSRPVPDILKPAYSFGGISVTQMVKPSVDNFIRVRQNISELIETFAQQVLSTELDQVMGDTAAAELDGRVALYNAIKSNRGVMVIDKDTEAFQTVTTPLSGLESLQAQAQEQMCSVASIPLVKYLGIQPSGLNASSDGEIRVFFDTVAAWQVRLYEPHIRFVLELIMQSELGEVNPDISHSWEPLWQMSEVERANVRKTQADTAGVYIDKGVLDVAEERERLANEEDGLYTGIEADKLPEPPDDPMDGINPVTGEAMNDKNGGESKGSENNDPRQNDFQPKDTPNNGKPVVVKPAKDEFKEEDHPRSDDGKFGSGGGSGSAAKGKPPGQTAKPGGGSAGQAAPAKGVAAAKAKAPPSTPATARSAMVQATRNSAGKLVAANGAALPPHIAGLKVPPAWTNVTYAETPGSALLVQGRDAKGRVQSLYSSEFSATNAAAKFERIEKLRTLYSSVQKDNEKAQKSLNPRTKDAADCLALIMTTGIRPGSDDNTKAEKEAFGATTLQGKHVVVQGKTVTLQFVGKKGVDLAIPVTDPNVAANLLERKKQAGASGKLFAKTNNKALNAHVAELPATQNDDFTTKDFRTLRGTEIAASTIATMESPKNMAQWKKSVLAVAKQVSAALGNTPTVALQSYISPTVFSAWGGPPN